MKYLDKLKEFYNSTAEFRAQVNAWWDLGGLASIFYLIPALFLWKIGTVPVLVGAGLGIFAYININVILKMKEK